MNLQKELLRKHIHGQKKYHAFSFLKDRRIMSKETTEELIDGINYLIYQLIKDRYSKKDLLTLSRAGKEGISILNKTYRDTIRQISKMSNRSSNKTIQVIAKMRDLIKKLQ